MATDLMLDPFSVAGDIAEPLGMSAKAGWLKNQGMIATQVGDGGLSSIKGFSVNQMSPEMLDQYNSLLKDGQPWLQGAANGLQVSGGATDATINNILKVAKGQGYKIWDGTLTRLFSRMLAPVAKLPEAFGYSRGELVGELVNELVPSLKDNPEAKWVVDQFGGWAKNVALEDGSGTIREVNGSIKLVPNADKVATVVRRTIGNLAKAGVTSDDMPQALATFMTAQKDVEDVSQGDWTLRDAGDQMGDTGSLGKVQEALVAQNPELANKVRSIGMVAVNSPEKFKPLYTDAGQLIGQGYTRMSQYLDDKASALLDHYVQTRDLPSDWKEQVANIPRPEAPLEAYVPASGLSKMMSLFVPDMTADQRIVTTRNAVRMTDNIANLVTKDGSRLEGTDVRDIVQRINQKITDNLKGWMKAKGEASTTFDKIWQQFKSPDLRLMDLPKSFFDEIAADFKSGQVIGGSDLAFSVKSAYIPLLGKDTFTGVTSLGTWARARYSFVDAIAHTGTQIRYSFNPVYLLSRGVEDKTIQWMSGGLAADGLPEEIMDFMKTDSKNQYAVREVYGDVNPMIDSTDVNRSTVSQMLPNVIRANVEQYIKYSPVSNVNTWEDFVGKFTQYNSDESRAAIAAHIAEAAQRGVNLSYTEALKDLHPDIIPYVNVLAKARDDGFQALENTLVQQRFRTRAERDANYLMIPFSWMKRSMMYLAQKADAPLWEGGSAALLRTLSLSSQSAQQLTGMSFSQLQSRYPYTTTVLSYLLPFVSYGNGDVGVTLNPWLRLIMAHLNIPLPSVSYNQQTGFTFSTLPVAQPSTVYNGISPSITFFNDLEKAFKEIMEPTKTQQAQGYYPMAIPDIESSNTAMLTNLTNQPAPPAPIYPTAEVKGSTVAAEAEARTLKSSATEKAAKEAAYGSALGSLGGTTPQKPAGTLPTFTKKKIGPQ
jgi:hypothetical protein